MSLLFPVINCYNLFSPCWLQHEFVSFSCVLEYSHGECAGLRRHRMFSGWKQISGLLLSRHGYPLSPQPPDLQLEAGSLHIYTNTAKSQGCSRECGLGQPLMSLHFCFMTSMSVSSLSGNYSFKNQMKCHLLWEHFPSVPGRIKNLLPVTLWYLVYIRFIKFST